MFGIDHVAVLIGTMRKTVGVTEFVECEFYKVVDRMSFTACRYSGRHNTAICTYLT